MLQDGDDKGSFVVINKENGEIANVLLEQQDIPDIHHKIEQARIVIEQDFPPEEKCYPEQKYGKSGNIVIHKLCTFCDFKERCWSECNEGKGLIKHTYASGPVYFSKLMKEPRKKFQSDNNGDEHNLGEELAAKSNEDSGGFGDSEINISER